MTEVPLDPIVAKLASALASDGTKLVLPDEAVAAARYKLRMAPPADKERLAHDLVAWALKLNRIAGNNAVGPRLAAAELALEVLGDEKAASDMFGAAGLGTDMAAAIGGSSVTRAPSAPAAKVATAKPVRGLKR